MSTTAAKPRARKRAPRRKKASPVELRLAVKDQPLVGLSAAAKILGILPPNIARYRRQGRMPEGIPVEGSAMVYVRSEVEALGKELLAERIERGEA